MCFHTPADFEATCWNFVQYIALIILVDVAEIKKDKKTHFQIFTQIFAQLFLGSLLEYLLKDSFKY